MRTELGKGQETVNGCVYKGQTDIEAKLVKGLKTKAIHAEMCGLFLLHHR